MNVLFSVRHRGPAGMASRAGIILSRFGPTPARMVRCLDRYVAITDGFGVAPTLPITARVLARNAPAIRSFVERGVEFAVHGLVHDDHAVRGLEEQRRSIRKAMAIFDTAGVPHSGFRAPFLRFNPATERALRELRVSYHSSQAMAFRVLTSDLGAARQAAYRRVLDLYGALDSEHTVVRPRLDNGLVRIPVALPDDESMIERLRLDLEARVQIWTRILRLTHRRAELFTIQLHPERIFELADALEHVLIQARRLRPTVWVARLDQIATWWRRRSRAVLRVDAIGTDRYRVHLHAEPEATLIVRGLPSGGATARDGDGLVARSWDFQVETKRKPVVGLSARTPESVVMFLREEGLPCERATDAAAYGAYLDVPPDDWDERSILKAIAASSGPLVRLSRWPHGAKSALAITGDIDSVTLQDFVWRVWETRPAKTSGVRAESDDRV